MNAFLRAAEALGDIERWLEGVSSRRLDNGLNVVVSPDDRSPLVATAVAYRAGTRDEAEGLGGTAHFLEHLMFKGSSRYPAGEIDRLTQAAGGLNNAFTSHDSTLYYFTFAADRWRLALDIEADRMAGLLFDSEEVKAERQVIHEEISMYEAEPWDRLLQEMRAACFGAHPYGRPVLGTRAELDAIGARELEAFHRRFYRPRQAVVVVVGDVEVEQAHAAVAEAFDLPADLPAGSVSPRPDPGPVTWNAGRLERRQGELARLEIALPAPAVDDDGHAPLRLLCGVLSLGRSSRLHRRLVDDEQLALWVHADVQETLDPGMLSITTELVPGADPARVEAEIFAALEGLRAAPPEPDELKRVRQVMLSDWLFGHERLDQRAFLLGGAATLADLDLPARSLTRLLAVRRDELLAMAQRHFAPEKAAVGWSWPEGQA